MHGAIDHQKQPSGPNHYLNGMYTSYYHVVQMFNRGKFWRIWRIKALPSKFPSQYFTVELNNFKHLYLRILFMVHTRVHTDRQ